MAKPKKARIQTSDTEPGSPGELRTSSFQSVEAGVEFSAEGLTGSEAQARLQK